VATSLTLNILALAFGIRYRDSIMIREPTIKMKEHDRLQIIVY